MVRNGKFAKINFISETGEAMPTKIGLHACYILVNMKCYFIIIVIKFSDQK